MRPERVAKLLGLGCEPGAVVDDRPAVKPYRAVCFLLAVCLAAVVAWAARDSMAQSERRRQDREQIERLHREVEELRGTLNRISWRVDDGTGKPDQEERR